MPFLGKVAESFLVELTDLLADRITLRFPCGRDQKSVGNDGVCQSYRVSRTMVLLKLLELRERLHQLFMLL